MINFFEKIETTRLKIQPFRADDAEIIFYHIPQDTDETRFLFWPPHKTIAETKEFLTKRISLEKCGGGMYFAILLKENVNPIGWLFVNLDGVVANIGFLLAKFAWGQGFMIEALEAISHWA